MVMLGQHLSLGMRSAVDDMSVGHKYSNTTQLLRKKFNVFNV